MRYFFALIFIFIYTSNLFAQKHDYNWVFGAFEIRDDINRDGNLLNFNGENIQLELFEKEYMLEFPNTTYSDSSGNLLFISNGCSIYGADGKVIENGGGLNPGETADEFCDDEYNSGYIGDSQTMLMLPSLVEENNTFLFHKRAEVENGFGIGYLLLSTIQKDENSQEYFVLDKNLLVEDSVDISVLTATKSIDLKNWWILATKRFSNEKLVVKLTEDGSVSKQTQAIGKRLSDNNESSSYSSFSPDGTKFVIFGEADGIQIFDFDRSFGELSNYQLIAAPQDFSGGRAGVAFSASGRFLYTCHWKKIYQYDMWQEDIEASVEVLDWEQDYDDFFGYETPFFRMERGPDCRIYLSAQNTTNTIHVIHHPDRKGAACGLQQNIRVPAYNIGTLPSYPNYRLGTGEVCDSTKLFPPDVISAIEDASNESQIDQQIILYPNPTSGEINLSFETFQKGNLVFQLYDMQGRPVFEYGFRDALGQVRVFNLDLVQGMYLYKITKEGELLKKGKVVVVE